MTCFRHLVLLAIVAALGAMASGCNGANRGPATPTVPAQPQPWELGSDRITLEMAAAFHIRLNEVCLHYLVELQYCGPLGSSGRGLYMTGGNDGTDLHRWLVYRVLPGGIPQCLFHVRLFPQRPSSGEVVPVAIGQGTLFAGLESLGLSTDEPLKELTGLTPRQFLHQLGESSVSDPGVGIGRE